MNYEVIEGYEVDKIKPFPKHVLLRWCHKEETKSGVLIPQNRQRANLMRGQVLAVGPDCDPLLQKGKYVEFNGLSEKEWLGPQDPADRDTVFFIREEELMGVLDGGFMALGDWVLIKPNEKPRESNGILIPQEKDPRKRFGTGIVKDVGPQGDPELIGCNVLYNEWMCIDLKLGDFEGELHNLVHSDEVEAVLDGTN